MLHSIQRSLLLHSSPTTSLFSSIAPSFSWSACASSAKCSFHSIFRRCVRSFMFFASSSSVSLTYFHLCHPLMYLVHHSGSNLFVFPDCVIEASCYFITFSRSLSRSWCFRGWLHFFQDIQISIAVESFAHLSLFIMIHTSFSSCFSIFYSRPMVCSLFGCRLLYCRIISSSLIDLCR